MQNDIRAKLVQVIEVEHLRDGDETSGIPPRWVRTYWDLKGNFLSENDPVIEELNRKNHHTTTEAFRA